MGARAPQSGYSNMPYYDKMTLHHSAGFSAETLEEGIAQMQAIQLFHQDIRGWSDIGYHFVIDKAGNIYQGRPETVIGAHTGGSNTETSEHAFLDAIIHQHLITIFVTMR